MFFTGDFIVQVYAKLEKEQSSSLDMDIVSFIIECLVLLVTIGVRVYGAQRHSKIFQLHVYSEVSFIGGGKQSL